MDAVVVEGLSYSLQIDAGRDEEGVIISFFVYVCVPSFGLHLSSKK